jgi:hypothetical protein
MWIGSSVITICFAPQLMKGQKNQSTNLNEQISNGKRNADDDNAEEFQIEQYRATVTLSPH